MNFYDIFPRDKYRLFFLIKERIIKKNPPDFHERIF